jgi:hypothetical protein
VSLVVQNETAFKWLCSTRSFEVTPHISGKHVHQDLGVLRIEYLAECELLNGYLEMFPPTEIFLSPRSYI